MDRSDFGELLIERHSVPRRLSDDEFRAWMTGRRIFISSVMDAEMRPDRDALRDWVHSWGGVPIMWEEIVPRDERADHTYVDGVERCNVFVMALGTMYGVADANGASPTYKENKRAAELGKPRLVAKKGNVSDQDRDPKLTAWIQSLYNELSMSKYNSPGELTHQIEAQLRETAAQQEMHWVKMGKSIFPGRIQQRVEDGTKSFTVTAQLSDRSVLESLDVGGSPWHRRDLDRITLGEFTFPVTDVMVETSHEIQSRTDIRITCKQSHQRNDGSALGGVAYQTRDGSQVTPAQQAELWAGYALFGKPRPEQRAFSLELFVYPDGPTLPEVLQREGARGWLAEGLTRLYIVEELTKKFGGRFHRLLVGLVTASGLRVEFAFQPENYGDEVATVQGFVQLP